MNEEEVKNLLEIVKSSTDRNLTLRTLVKLRTHHVKDRSGIIVFRENLGIYPMVRLLNKPYEKILETALSILGNCCTENESCKEVSFIVHCCYVLCATKLEGLFEIFLLSTIRTIHKNSRKSFKNECRMEFRACGRE